MSPVFLISSGRFVGVDAHIDPLKTFEFNKNFCKNGAFCRDNVGIVPYERYEVGK